MAEDIKTRLRRGFEEGINQNRPEVWDALIADDYVNHTFPAPAPGREGFKQVMAMFNTAFPDIHITVEDIIVEGDKAASRGVFTGTHKREFMGVPATGKPIRVSYLDIWRFRDGKGVENWVQMDLLGLLQQLGALPAPEPVTA